MLQRGFLFLVLLTLAPIASAGEFNAKLSIGDEAPSWTSLPGVDRKRHSLQDLAAAPLVLVVFTCNSCDVATDYEDRIVEFAKRRKGKVAVVAINVSRKPADSLARMRERSAEKKLPYPYLFDESQRIGRAYGASYTPEFFLLDQDRKIAYMGSMDDSTYADRVTKRYLDDAVDKVLAGKQPAPAETAPRGCRIRYPRSRPLDGAREPERPLIEGEKVREHVRHNPPPTLSE